MDLAVSLLARLALGAGHRQARNGRSLASCRLSFVDLGGVPGPTRTRIFGGDKEEPWLLSVRFGFAQQGAAF